MMKKEIIYLESITVNSAYNPNNLTSVEVSKDSINFFKYDTIEDINYAISRDINKLSNFLKFNHSSREKFNEKFTETNKVLTKITKEL